MEEKKAEGNEEAPKLHPCSGPLCNGMGEAVLTIGTYCPKCNTRVSRETRENYSVK